MALSNLTVTTSRQAMCYSAASAAIPATSVSPPARNSLPPESDWPTRLTVTQSCELASESPLIRFHWPDRFAASTHSPWVRTLLEQTALFQQDRSLRWQLRFRVEQFKSAF